MRVLIVDDEVAARRRLTMLLEELDVELVGEAANGVEALELVRSHRPDLLLLDIAMPEVDGFEVARHLPEPKPFVIFQTAYDEHALKAFEHEAVDYVVKPITQKRLAQALERAQRRLDAATRPLFSPEVLMRLEAAIGHSATVRRSRILVRVGTGHRPVALRDIILFRADEGLVWGHTASAHHLTDYTLNELEDRLTGTFVRANRADLINIDRIERIVSNGDGSATLTLAAGTTVRVSRRRATEVKRALDLR